MPCFYSLLGSSGRSVQTLNPGQQVSIGYNEYGEPFMLDIYRAGVGDNKTFDFERQYVSNMQASPQYDAKVHHSPNDLFHHEVKIGNVASPLIATYFESKGTLVLPVSQ